MDEVESMWKEMVVFRIDLMNNWIGLRYGSLNPCEISCNFDELPANVLKEVKTQDIVVACSRFEQVELFLAMELPFEVWTIYVTLVLCLYEAEGIN